MSDLIERAKKTIQSVYLAADAGPASDIAEVINLLIQEITLLRYALANPCRFSDRGVPCGNCEACERIDNLLNVNVREEDGDE